MNFWWELLNQLIAEASRINHRAHVFVARFFLPVFFVIF